MAHIEVDTKKIIQNLQRVQGVCNAKSVRLNVVTKFSLSHPEIIRILCENGATVIADANMENFKNLPADLCAQCKKTVIKTRLSDIYEIAAIAKNAPHNTKAIPDVVYVSDEKILDAVKALPQKIRPAVFLIAETGDLRDGFYPAEIPAIAARYSDLTIAGISANFGCLSGKMPTMQGLEQLHKTVCAMENAMPQCAVKPVVSIGGTVAYPLLQNAPGGLAGELRMGEGIFFGHDSSAGAEIPGFNRDAWTLSGEIIEVREKQIDPVCEGGHTAFGGDPPPRPLGKRRCAVLDFGLLGASMADMTPLDCNIAIAGQTYDFTVVDITESRESYQTGDFIPFRAMYAAAARAMLNPFVKKIFR